MLGDGVEDVRDMGELGGGGCLGNPEEGGGDWKTRCIHGDIKPCWRFIIIGICGEMVCVSPISITPTLCHVAVQILPAGGEGRFVDGTVG